MATKKLTEAEIRDIVTSLEEVMVKLVRLEEAHRDRCRQSEQDRNVGARLLATEAVKLREKLGLEAGDLIHQDSDHEDLIAVMGAELGGKVPLASIERYVAIIRRNVTYAMIRRHAPQDA